jgi:hypothetical protein
MAQVMVLQAAGLQAYIPDIGYVSTRFTFSFWLPNAHTQHQTRC